MNMVPGLCLEYVVSIMITRFRNRGEGHDNLSVSRS